MGAAMPAARHGMLATDWMTRRLTRGRAGGRPRRRAGASVLMSLALLWAAPPTSAQSTAPSADSSGAPSPMPCQPIQDDGERLACYDRQFGAPDATKRLPHKATPSPSPPAAQPAPAGNVASVVQSSLSKEWELSTAEKRGTFVVRTYLPSYFLPVHATSNLGPPSSPVHPALPATSDYRKTEAKFQLSLRTKILQDVLLPDADLWFSYTQVALWQLWDAQDSRPMRSTDYEPQATYVIPLVSHAWSHLPHDWDWRMVQLGFAHQSNGQSDPLSRDWNHVFAATVFEREGFGLRFRVDKRVLRSGLDDNPDLVDFIGRESVSATWRYGRVNTALSWRTNLGSLSTGAVQFDGSYPMRVGDPEGLRWYLQVFSGYGETLLDYNRRQTSLGFGLALYQF